MIDDLFTYCSYASLGDNATKYLDCILKVDFGPYAADSLIEEIHVDHRRGLLSIVHGAFSVDFKIKESSMIEELFLWESERHVSNRRRRYFNCTLKVVVGRFLVGERADTIEIDLEEKVIYVTYGCVTCRRHLTLTVSETW